jgi:glutathione synthase/RimK-type ligase-like ATP-grasp enzyme
MQQLASAALTAVGADYAGIDLIRTPDGRLLVLEVNSNPSWKGLQRVADIDIADAVVEDFLFAVHEHLGLRSCPA